MARPPTSAPSPASTEELARVHEALRQSEASRRESQVFFEKSFEANPALMAISSAIDGRIIEVNPALISASGRSREEIVGRTSLELGFWLNPAQRDDFFRQLNTHGFVRDVEADFRTKSGGILSLLVNADRIELGGRPCMLTVAVDVTERRRRDRIQAAIYEIAQAVLAGRDLPALFAELHRIVGTLIPAHNFYVALLSPDRALLSFPYFVDERAAAPAPRAMVAGLTEYVIDTARPLRTAATETTVFEHAGRRYQPTGKPSAMWLGAPLVIDGRAIGVITVQDYHDPAAYTDADLQLLMFVADQAAVAIQRRQAEVALARAERRYRSIFENAVEGIYVASADGRFLRANPALARILGYASPEELLAAIHDIGRQVYRRPGRRDEFLRLVQEGDAVSDFESEVCRRDGSVVWISESVRVVRDPAGAIDHFEGVAIDITERREAGRALEEAKEAADAASRAKSYFLASVSHELRTPLNGILGYTQILQRDASLGEKQRDGVRVIHESADHLLALINDILDFSRIEADRVELHAEDFDLVEFAAGIGRVFAPRAHENGILFESTVAGNLPRWVRGDEQRLRQVIFNLVANAVKFTREGGVVFSVEPAAAAVRFSVSDTGIGIAPGDQSKLFEPFAQVGNQASAAATGTGLGLAISRNLVERMGGRLQVESMPGRGSRFWFEVALPVATAAAAPTAPSARRRIAGYEGPRRRVLVVDDHAANRAVIVDMLAPLDFELAEAADGSTALSEVERFRPDLVLMDLRLPGGMSGIETARQLRATRPSAAGDLRRLGIIAVSASAFDGDRDECFAAGCDDFLAKPFRYEQLEGMIARVLGLTWRHGEPDDAPTATEPPVHPPPAREAAAIHELAAKGDVVAIRARADALLAQDPRFAPFCRNVLELATRFRMKAIRQYVGRFMS